MEATFCSFRFGIAPPLNKSPTLRLFPHRLARLSLIYLGTFYFAAVLADVRKISISVVSYVGHLAY